MSSTLDQGAAMVTGLVRGDFSIVDFTWKGRVRQCSGFAESSKRTALQNDADDADWEIVDFDTRALSTAEVPACVPESEPAALELKEASGAALAPDGGSREGAGAGAANGAPSCTGGAGRSAPPSAAAAQHSDAGSPMIHVMVSSPTFRPPAAPARAKARASQRILPSRCVPLPIVSYRDILTRGSSARSAACR